MASKRLFTKSLSAFVCLVLITAMVLTVTGCQTKMGAEALQPSEITGSDEVQTVTFPLKVIDGDGNEKTFTVTTAEKTVGAALLKEGLIEGKDGPYGLYVKSVNGISADYEKDGTYWAFYIGEDYAMTGVDATDITEGTAYAFKVEK